MTCVDLFSGLGGFSEGAKDSGANVLWAANHWPEAVRWHAQNHPGTTHACEDLHRVNWTKVPDHEVLLASPCCQGHSRARGKDRPHHDSARSTAWAVVDAAEAKRPDWIVVENVPEFLKWALFPSFQDALQRLGYCFEARVLDASEFGVPQSRKRVFIICSRNRRAVKWPAGRCSCVPCAREVIQWHSGQWSKVGEKCPATIRKWELGRAALGEEFLLAYYGNERGGRSVDRPFGTITTRDRFAVVKGDRLRMLTVSECRRAMGFPDTYQIPSNRRLAVHLLGNAVCPPVAAAIISALRAQ